MLGDMFEKRQRRAGVATAPPEGWRSMIHRWERLDTAPTWAAIAAFSLFLADLVLR
jgi:hypothetical protein